MSHRDPPWGAPPWPPTRSDARTRPGRAVARLGLDSRCLIVIRRGGPRHGLPHPPTLGRAPAEPWRASGLIQDVSSRHHHRHVVASAGEVAVEHAGDEAGLALDEPGIAAEIPVRPEAIGMKHDERAVRPRVRKLVQAPRLVAGD